MAPTVRESARGRVYHRVRRVAAPGRVGPVPAFRQLGYIAAFAVLLALGVHRLRRETASEFPAVQSGDALNMIGWWYPERGSPGHASRRPRRRRRQRRQPRRGA